MTGRNQSRIEMEWSKAQYDVLLVRSKSNLPSHRSGTSTGDELLRMVCLVEAVVCE